MTYYVSFGPETKTEEWDVSVLYKIYKTKKNPYYQKVRIFFSVRTFL
jgi:hypothetical protein